MQALSFLLATASYKKQTKITEILFVLSKNISALKE